MKKYIPILKRTQIFAGITDNEIESMLTCLGAKLKYYKKGEYVLRQGERMSLLAVLVEGKLHIQSDDYWGNRSILGNIDVGEMFGEAYIAPQSDVLINDVVALDDSAVIFFDVTCMVTTCSNACRFHSVVAQNLLFAMSEKNRKLVQKLSHMHKRTTREKLISYLSAEAKRQNNHSFSIPFNRQQLADFLSVDRSAMSNELCKLRDEGMIEFSKNSFRLL